MQVYLDVVFNHKAGADGTEVVMGTPVSHDNRNIDVLHTHDANRVLAFRRWEAGDELLVIASLNNSAFAGGYRIQSSRIADGRWREIFNSDTAGYGGSGLVDADPIPSAGGVFSARLPANSVLVFQRQ